MSLCVCVFVCVWRFVCLRVFNVDTRLFRTRACVNCVCSCIYVCFCALYGYVELCVFPLYFVCAHTLCTNECVYVFAIVYLCGVNRFSVRHLQAVRPQ